MEHIFLIVLGMSGTASVVILVILLARLVLRRAPKVFSYALWVVALFRLLCPFTFSSPWGMVRPIQVESSEDAMAHISVTTSMADVVISVASAPAADPGPAPAVSFAPVDDPVISAPDTPVPAARSAPRWQSIAGFVWLAGVLLLLGYSAVSLLLLRRRLIGSMPLDGAKNVRVADHIPSPFVLGLAQPQIYLPSGLPEHERDYILLHERTHIRRGDHIFRALAWLALAVHWFNPLVWLAFHLAGKDMEMSCDEAVLRVMGRDIRADYSASLLRLSVGGRLPAGPLAFGGGDAQKRIKNVLSYKKPAFWVMVAALIAVLCAGAALATNYTDVIIDPDSITSFTAITASSSTTTAQFTGVYTAEDLQKDLSNSDNARRISLEDGAELVDLINSYRKTIYGRGELTLDGQEHQFVRMDCKDGSFYLLDYWYWNGFSWNPLHGGEDPYTTLVTYYDAEGNAGTTWQMEYDFDQAYCEWARSQPLGGETASGFSLEELSGGLSADLTMTLDQGEDGDPFVRISGTIGGVTLSRAIWYPEGTDYLFGPLTMEYDFVSGGANIAAGWADEAHTSVTVSTQYSAAFSSKLNAGYWEFTVDLSNGGVVTEMVAHPLAEVRTQPAPLWDDEAVMCPESITDAEALPAARIMAVVLWAAEDYYTRNAPETSVLTPVYSLSENGHYVNIEGLDCDGALWNWDTYRTRIDAGMGVPELGNMLGLLSITNPRFLGGRFAEAEGGAIAAYYPDESGPLLFVGFDDRIPVDNEIGWDLAGTGTYFTVDLASGTVTKPQANYVNLDAGLSDAELASVAQTLAQIIQGAADFYENLLPSPPYDEPYTLLEGAGRVRIGQVGDAYVEWDDPRSLYFDGDPGFCCPRLAGRTADGYAAWNGQDWTILDVHLTVNDERAGGSKSGFDITFAVDLNRWTVLQRDFQSQVEGETLELTDQEMIDMARSLDTLMHGARLFYYASIPLGSQP